MTSSMMAKAILDEYKPTSWAERLAVRYANEALRAGAEPTAVLAVLEAARSEIDDWSALEARYGLPEALKLWGQWLHGSFGGSGRVPAAEWMATVSRTPIEPSPERQTARDAADPIFNLYGRGFNPNYGQPGAV